MLPKEQIENIKAQLFDQLEKTNLPNKEEIKSSIKTMNAKQLEQFLIQNKLIKTDQEGQEQKCIFCSIVFGDIPSTKILENEKAIAILEINPISKAHSIIIPKEHIINSESLPKEAFELAEKVADRIKQKFNPKDITIASANLFGHEIINVLPVYENETLESPKKQAKPEELLELQKELIKEKEKVEEKIEEPEITEENTWLPKRVP